MQISIITFQMLVFLNNNITATKKYSKVQIKTLYCTVIYFKNFFGGSAAVKLIK